MDKRIRELLTERGGCMRRRVRRMPICEVVAKRTNWDLRGIHNVDKKSK